MKKITGILTIAAFALMLTSSCKKDESGVTITKVINVELKVNESYSYEVPRAGDADDVMQMQKQASNFLTCKITPQANGNVVLDYTPALNYTGTDEIMISNQEGSHGNGGHGGHGNCSGGKHHHDTTVYDFKITIKGINTRAVN